MRTGLKHPEPALLVQIGSCWLQAYLAVRRVSDPDPCAGVRVAISEEILVVLRELDLCVPFRQVCALDVHGDVSVLFWISRPEQFPVWGRIHEQELAKEDPVRTLQQVVVKLSWIGQALNFLLLLEGFTRAKEVSDRCGYFGFFAVAYFLCRLHFYYF